MYIVQGTKVMVSALLCSSSEYNDDQSGCMSVMMPAANLLKTDPSFCSLSNDPDGPFKGTVTHSFPLCLLIVWPIKTGQVIYIFPIRMAPLKGKSPVIFPSVSNVLYGHFKGPVTLFTACLLS
jgi:hypothetical protein